MTSTSEHAIGIFDSGVGGLTVLKAIQEHLPNERLIYLGDTARVPYGCKSANTVKRYSRENAAFLSQFSIKLLIVACNTATAFALDELNTHCPFPILGVILPGAEAAIAQSRQQKVGVIATKSTVQSQAYDRALRYLNPKVEILSLATPLLVPLVEENYLEHPATSLILTEYLDPIIRAGVDTLLLGCTHFPLLKPLIQRLVGSSLQLVDSAECCALKLETLLTQLHLRSSSPESKGTRYFVTDDDCREFRLIGERLLGQPLDTVECVSVTEVEPSPPQRRRRTQKAQPKKVTPIKVPRSQGQGLKRRSSTEASASSQ